MSANTLEEKLVANKFLNWVKTGVKEINQATRSLPVIFKNNLLLNRENIQLKQNIISKNQTISRLIRLSNQRMESVSRKQSAYLASLSHELRNHLAVIKSEIINGAEQGSVNLEILSKSAQMATGLTEETVLLSRLSLKGFKMEKQKFNLSDLIRETCLEQEAQIKNKGISLKCFPQKNIIIKGNLSLFKKALTNVIQNAILYNKKNGLIEIYLKKYPGFIKIAVLDTGMGMTQEQCLKAFDAFYQSQEAKAANTQSNGLGLTLAQKIVKKHQGIIKIKSQDKKGTAVVIKLKA
ncbi:MAG: HAMP domain-containing sensor histidine kinase [Patescibacteria group bacterium]|nr:HAMP domain-containing histidine kinase [Patescibacteria group bacterium]